MKQIDHRTPLVYIDTDTGVDFRDEAPWRSYMLTTSGNTLVELLEKSVITEVDQEGGELASYPLYDATLRIVMAGEEIIAGEYLKALQKREAS